MLKRLVLKENTMETLKEGDKIGLFGKIYEVEKTSNGCFLSHLYDHNYKCFIDAGLDPEKRRDFQQKILGYERKGIFPYCKTLEDLTKLVQAIKDYKMNKKIIGYKAPIDLFNGTHKKGSIYTFQGKEYGYASHEGSTVPREIVETWEPVYEVQKLQKVGEHTVNYSPGNNTVKIGCTTYSKEQLNQAASLLSLSNLKNITCEDSTVINLNIINQLIEGLES